MRFDVLVVRGGTAGCVLAARLSEDGERRVWLNDTVRIRQVHRHADPITTRGPPDSVVQRQEDGPT